ncbi:hypothetical protein BGX28_005575 [Mortierella sp. GBA30]|nr:hypothetical protein BGX28_005575 [Mortierella sp. GBA30]
MFDPESTVSLTGEGKGFGNNKGGQPFLSSVGLYQGLSRVQAYSAMAFGAFTFIHMVPPVLASVGGIDLADKALMWGRVYYQAPGIEQILVLNALGIHIVSGLSKALIRLVWKAKRAYHVYISKSPVDAQDAQDAVNDLTYSSSSSSETVVVTATSTRTSTSAAASTGSSSDTTVNSGSGSAPGLFPYHRLVGWILTPIVFDHLNTMRIVPLNILGDSSMIDFSFISYLYRSGQQHPFVYVLLVALSSYHMISGGLAAYNLVLPRGSERRIKVRDMIQSKKSRLAAVSMLAVVALVGVYRIMTVEGVIPMSKVYARLMLSV